MEAEAAGADAPYPPPLPPHPPTSCARSARLKDSDSEEEEEKEWGGGETVVHGRCGGCGEERAEESEGVSLLGQDEDGEHKDAEQEEWSLPSDALYHAVAQAQVLISLVWLCFCVCISLSLGDGR